MFCKEVKNMKQHKNTQIQTGKSGDNIDFINTTGNDIPKEEIIVEKLLNDVKTRWLDNNAKKVDNLLHSVRPLRPDIGFYLTVNGLDIGEEIFPEEYKIIYEAYLSVLRNVERRSKENKK